MGIDLKDTYEAKTSEEEIYEAEFTLVALIMKMIKEHLDSDEHTMGLLVDTEIVLKSDVDTSVYTELQGVYHVVFKYTDRELEDLYKNMRKYDLMFCRKKLVKLITLYLDTACEYTLGIYYNHYITNNLQAIN